MWQNMPTELWVMNNGHVALTGTPKEVFSHVSELEEMGLAAPQTRLCNERS